MKTNLIRTCLLAALLSLPAVAQAQFTYFTNNGTIAITSYTGPGGDVTIPDTINGLPVTSIWDFAFSHLTNVSRFTIPDSVVSLGGAAFEGCALGSVTIGSGVTIIGNYTFDGCTSLTNVTIGNSVTSIGESAFYGCTSLTTITIPSTVTWITGYAFDACYGLTSVYFKGNAPGVVQTTFSIIDVGFFYIATAYYLPGTTGWSGFSTHSGLPVLPWNPLIQTGDSSFGVRTNQFGFNIAWAGGQTVVVEACTNLHNPVWTPLATNTFTSDSLYFSDSQWTNYPARLYRVRLP